MAMRLALLAAALMSAYGVISTFAQTPPAQQQQLTASPSQAERLFHFALSSARFQARAAELALTKQARPEVHELARAMLEFRRTQLPELEAQAQAAGVPIPAVLEFEHTTLLENLQPLEFIAFSRRWSEVQIQALQQEIGIYGAVAATTGPPASSGGVSGVRAPAELDDFLSRAQKVRAAIQE